MALDSRPETAQVAFALNHYRHLKKLHRYVLLNADKPLKLSVVAAHVGISPSRLSRLFQQKAGITYSAWLRLDRISRAEELLARSDEAIANIAAAVGFCNSRTFERAFKLTSGMTPSEYRKQVRAQTLSQR